MPTADKTCATCAHRVALVDGGYQMCKALWPTRSTAFLRYYSDTCGSDVKLFVPIAPRPIEAIPCP